MLPNNPSLYVGIWGAAIGGLLFAQWRTFIVGIDLLFITIVTTVLSFIFALSQNISPLDFVVTFLAISIFWSAVLVAITSILSLIYIALFKERTK
jgi:hypothetical protein